MIYDLQKASLLKRFSAFLLDLILVATLAVGFALLVALIVDFDSYNVEMKQAEQACIDAGIDTKTITLEQYNALSDELRQLYDKYDDSILVCFSLIFTEVSVGLFMSFLICEFIVPLILKNGRTVGKKVFNIGVMQINGIRVRTVSLFVRAMLGKYAIETMVPLSLATFFLFVTHELFLLIVFVAIVLLQVVLFFVTKNYSFIHDVLASTVVVDLSQQLIFETPQDLVDYKAQIHAQQVADDNKY